MIPSEIEKWNAELESAVTNLSQYHTDMQMYSEYYKYSAFYGRQAGEAAIQRKQPRNYLKIFVDKNVQYTSTLPEFKVLGTPEDRENANIREKILYAVHRKSGTSLLQKKWARDKTIRSMAIAETTFNLDTRCVEVKRYHPRNVYWKRGNGNDDNVNVFWAVFSISKQEAWDKYKVVPTKDTLSMSVGAKADPHLSKLDGQTWFTFAIRWDHTTRRAWIGDKVVENPHDHRMGMIPIDIDVPFVSDDAEGTNQLGDFYMEQLIPLQAELNDKILKRNKIIKRLSNPIIWGRGIKPKGFDDVKRALANGDSGILALGQTGEVGILQIQELNVLNEDIAEIKADMQRLSGFSAASFGESVGANTSGDALGMYFTPTENHVQDQNINMVAFFESINAKILRLYDVFGRTGETFTLEGYAPKSTVASTDDYKMNPSGGYKLSFTRDAINGNYISKAIPPSVVPRNELAEKQFWVTSAKDRIVSRTTAYEKIGLESPEDEKSLLELEQSEPLLNPDGTEKMMSGAMNAQSLMNPAGDPNQPQLPVAQSTPAVVPAA